MNLVLGAQNITEREPTQVRQTSTSFIIHPSWNRPKYAYDIAVVKLSSPINTTDAIQIIKVVSGNSTYAGETGNLKCIFFINIFFNKEQINFRLRLFFEQPTKYSDFFLQF